MDGLRYEHLVLIVGPLFVLLVIFYPLVKRLFRRKPFLVSGVE